MPNVSTLNRLEKTLPPKILPKLEWFDSPTKHSFTKLFKEIKLKDRLHNDVYLKSEPYIGSDFNFIVRLADKDRKELGTSYFTVNHFDKSLFGVDMKVNDEQMRETKRGLGEILTLSTIMEFLKNNFRQMGIFSSKKAVFFNHHYKFEPAIDDKAVALKFLKWLKEIKNKETAPLQKKAEELNDYLLNTTIGDKELIESANTLLKRFLEIAEASPKPHKRYETVGGGCDMILTRERAEENKGFFNTLFERYGLDFKL